MIKVKDGYAKLIGTTYSGSVSRVLLSNGGDHILGNSNGNIPLNNGTVNTNLNADMLDGLHIHAGRNNEVNKIVRTDISGYIQAGWINTTSGDIGAGAINKIYCSNDNYIRYKTPANFFPTLANSGNDISITVAGQNRKLTVGYATNTDTVDGEHASAFTRIVGRYSIYTSGTAPYNYIHLFRIANSSGYSTVDCEIDFRTRYHSAKLEIRISTAQYPYNSGGSSISIVKKIISGRTCKFWVLPTIQSSNYNYYDVYYESGAWNSGSYGIIFKGSNGSVVFEHKGTNLASLPDKVTEVTSQWISWNDIAGKPGSFNPSAHTHSWDSITGKPSSFTPSAHNHDGRYLRLDGSDTMTGVLKVKGNQYNDGYDGAINMNNSDIYGLNSIYTADKSDTQAEGIHFWRDSTHVDTLRMMDGKLLFTPNRPLGGSGTEQTVLHTGNSYIKGGVITINGSSLTPLTSLPSHTHTYIVAEDLRAKYPGQILDPQRMKLSFLSASTLGIKNDGSYYDVITVRSYADSSGGSDNALLFSKNSNSLYHTRFAFGSTSSWGSPLLIIDSGNIGSQSVAYASKAGSVAWDSITGKPSSFTPSSHTHSWTSITDKLVAGNEFNIVNAGFNADIWFNYRPINDSSKTASIRTYIMGNGAKGMASVTASGFIKNGSNSNYVLLGDGGHKTISSLSVNYANSAGNADTVDRYHANTIYNAPSFTVNNSNTSNTYILLATITISGTSLAMAEFTTLFQNRECLDSSSFILSGAIRRNSTTSVVATLSYITLHTGTPRNIYLRSDDGVTFLVYIQSAAGTWTTYYRAIPIVDSRNITYSNTGTTSPISGSVLNITATKGGNVNYASSAGSADTATKLTSSAGNAALPIYFSNGKPVACTASSVFSNLSNSGNNLSITVAGQNRTLTVGYATSAGSATKVIVNQHTTNDTNYPLVWSNQNNSNNVTENQLYKSWSDLYYNPKNKRLTVGGSVVASSFIKSGGTSQQLLRADGGIATFNWSGQSGQPTWLWGGNNQHSYYVYNPSNFRVAYATSSGSADTLDGVHLSEIFTAFGNNGHNITATIGGTTKSFLVNWATDSDKLDGYHASNLLTSVTNTNNGISVTVGGTTKSVSNISVNYAASAGSVAWDNVTGRPTILNPTNYYWANVKISASPSTTTSPTVHTLTATRVCAGYNPEIDNSISCSNWFRSSGATGWYNATYQGGWYMSDTSWVRTHNGVGIYTSGQIYSPSSIRMGNIYLQNTNEINSASGIHLNYQNSGNITLCYGGGNVGIGTSPLYKLDVNGNIHSSGTINCNALNVGSTLSIKDSVISCSASDISIESKESGRLLINSREVLSYNLDRISMTNKTQFVHRLGLGVSSPNPIDSICTTDDVTVYIGSLTESSFFEFRPAMDGQLLFLKIGKLHSNTYFWCTARNCEVIRADNFSTYLNRDQNKDCFGDGCARIFIYKQITERWYEFYCG